MIVWHCFATPNHRAPAEQGCQVCVDEIVNAVADHKTPAKAVQHFRRVMNNSVTELARRKKWWNRKDPKEPLQAYRFSSAALDVAVAHAFYQKNADLRGFPPVSQYRTFAEELGRPGVDTLTYYDLMALVAGYSTPYKLEADQETIALLEEHRSSLSPLVSGEISRALIEHTGLQDYNLPPSRRNPAPMIRQWIAEYGQLPKPVVTYRQESQAWATSTPAMRWWEYLHTLKVGDIMSWEDRPVSTSLDPGFTRLMATGWDDRSQWSLEVRQIHFMITASRGYYLGSATSMPYNEHELILAPGQQFRVRGFEQHRTDNMIGKKFSGGQHRMYIVLEEVPA